MRAALPFLYLPESESLLDASPTAGCAAEGACLACYILAVLVRRILALVLAGSALIFGGAATQASQGSQAARSIKILSAKAEKGVVTVRVSIAGWKMYPTLVGKAPKPDGGHWHIYVNGRYNNFSTSATRGQTNPKKKLGPGEYRIGAVLANNNHTEPKPKVRSAPVIVTVESAAQTT
jgi:hypothetical protein